MRCQKSQYGEVRPPPPSAPFLHLAIKRNFGSQALRTLLICAYVFPDISNGIFTAGKRDDEIGHSQFATHELLAMNGRGYLRNDVLEIRAIIRVDAVSNMAPPPPTKDTSTGQSQHPSVRHAHTWPVMCHPAPCLTVTCLSKDACAVGR